jgi:nucleotidyltransferase substrate binding protein (TIGR01987 family)
MAPNPDVRWKQRFHSFRKAFGRLRAAAAIAAERELSDLEQQGLIQAFEFTHELAWKVLKDFLESRGVSQIYGSKDATRAGFAHGLIKDGDDWIAMIESRNQTSHSYDENIANSIAQAVLSLYLPQFEQFEQEFARLEKEES